MVFFTKLAKTLSTKEPDGAPAEGPAPGAVGGGGVGGGGGGPSSGTAAPLLAPAGTQEVKEKSEKKKKPKDGQDAGQPVGAAPAGGGGESRAAAAGTARAQAGLSVNDFISKTKNQQRQGLKPSGPELIAYARYLGIDPVADHDLLWIAVEALEAPLPSDWTEHFDSNDRVFYYNATTRVSSWTHPLEHIYRETYKTIVNFRNATLAPAERGEKLHQLQAEVKQMEIDVHKDIAQWSEHTDEQGNRFYFNREERQSTWTDPRPAKCQILYLRMKMLRLLQSGAGATAGFTDHKSEKLSHFGAAPHGGHDVGSGGLEDDPAMKRSKVDDLMDEGARPDPMSDNSDSDNSDDRKTKKRKKKKKKKDKESAPVRLGAPQKLSGAGPGSDDAGGVGVAGRARVKAGIRLEPIAPGSPEQAVAAPPAKGSAGGSSGVRGSSSVPSL